MTKTYEPDQYISIKFFSLLRQILSELLNSSDLGLKFFKRDFLVRYRQSLLGLSWAILMPILSTGIFFILYQSGVIKVGPTQVPYIVYAFYGMTIWQLFTATVLTVADMVPGNKSLMVTVRIPRFANLYSPVLTALTDLGIRLVLLLVLMRMTGTSMDLLWMLMGLVSWVPLILFGVGIGLFITIVNCITRDISKFLQTVLHFLMFVSPVLYPMKGYHGLFGLMAQLNPLIYLLDFPREVFFHGDFSNGMMFGWMVLFSVSIFFTGLRFYYLSLSRALEIV